MKTYSLDFRQKIVETYDRGGISQEKLAERFCVSVFFVKKLFRQRRAKSSIAPLPRKGWQKSLMTAQIEDYLVSLYKANHCLKLAEASAQIETEFGIRLSNPTVCRAVKRLKLRGRKKSVRKITAPV